MTHIRKPAHLLVGALIGALLVQPAFASHTPTHTQTQIKKLNKKIKKRYTKAAVDSLLAGKADAGASFTKPEADARFVRFARTLVVSPVGTPLENGAALRQAAGSIAGSAANPYLLHLEPGVFDLGTTGLVLPAHVDVQGSGTGATSIACACGSAANTSIDPGAIGAAALRQGANTEIRSLTVRNSGGHANVHGIDVAGGPGDAFSLSDVVVEVQGAGQKGVGIWVRDTTDVRLHDVEASASGTGPSTSYYGIELISVASARLDDVIARAQGVVASTYGLMAMTVPDLTLEGGRYEAKDASQNYAIRLHASDAEIKDVTADATGGGDGYHAAYFLNSDFLVLGSIFEAIGEEGYGITLARTQAGASTGRVESSVVTTDSTVCCGYGITASSLTGSAFILVGGTEITADGPTVRAVGAVANVQVGGTRLAGDPAQGSAGGVVTCAGVWDELQAFFASTCP